MRTEIRKGIARLDELCGEKEASESFSEVAGEKSFQVQGLG